MSEAVDCSEHGQQALALLCVHLADGSARQMLHGGAEDLRVAICPACDRAALGDWSALADESFQPACEACYWQRAGELDASADALLDGNLVALAAQEMDARNRAFAEETGEARLPRWRFGPGGLVELQYLDERVAWTLRAQTLGTVDEAEMRWTWAWADDRLRPEDRARAWELQGLGHRLGLAPMRASTVGGCTPAMAWMFAQLGALLCGAKAIKKLRMGPQSRYLAVLDAWPPPKLDPLAAFADYPTFPGFPGYSGPEEG